MKQKIFDYKIKPKYNIEDFYVTNANIEAYNFIINIDDNLINNIIIYGPNKSGKTHLGNIWSKINKAIIYNKNKNIFNIKNNIFIDDYDKNTSEEDLFHLINHCSINNLKLLLTTNKHINEQIFNLPDLSSRIKSFVSIEIKMPDDELIVNLINKLLSDKQIIVNNPEIFPYILKRINRTYEDIYVLVKKLDQFSLEKKKEINISLIRELI